MAASLLVVALCAGWACSSKADTSKPFCKAMDDSSELFSQLNTDGSVDAKAFLDGLANIERLAPSELRPQVAYLRKAYAGYFEVGAKRMTEAQFEKRFPSVKIQTYRAQIDEWMRKHCGFGIPS